VVFYSSDGRALVVNTALLNLKSTRSTTGVGTLTLRKKALLDHIRPLEGSGIQNVTRYRSRSIPAAGAIIKEEDAEDQQLSLEL
jgi:DNA gyrase subunit A